MSPRSGIPWRVALQQRPPALPRPPPECTYTVVNASLLQRTATRPLFLGLTKRSHSTRQKQSSVILSPAIGEAFVDGLITKAHGRRLTDEEIGAGGRNADYVLNEWIFELKDLQEEGLEKPERQKKIAALFAPESWGDEVEIAPELLDGDELRRYMDIAGGPIQTQVKSASKQIRDTKTLLGKPEMRGGLIFLNTGYGSLPPSLFEMLVERYAAKDSSQIEYCICISAWVLTNGFDWDIQFKFYPEESPEPVIDVLKAAFGPSVDELMTAWARNGFRPTRESLLPVKPVAFDIAGRTFAWEPPDVPRSWEQ